MWDCLRIGAGAPPLKTPAGWLLIYHGVDIHGAYCLGLTVLDRDDPGRVLFRSWRPILRPETPQERGGDLGWVPNVVFTCGAVLSETAKGATPEVIVYYGAADASIFVAKASIEALLPASLIDRKPYPLGFSPSAGDAT